MSGVPPLIGFFGKYFVINSAIIDGNYFISLVIVITSVITAVYYLQIIKTLFLPDNANNSTISSLEPNNLSPILAFIVAILTLFILFFMVYPTPILNSIHLIALSSYYF